MTVYDGKSPISKQLGKFCGNQLPESQTSSAGDMLIHLKTNVMDPSKRLEIFYHGECGGYLSDMNGVISYPSENSTYAANQVCLWLIKLPMGFKVNVSIHFLDIESHEDCE